MTTIRKDWQFTLKSQVIITEWRTMTGNMKNENKKEAGDKVALQASKSNSNSN